MIDSEKILQETQGKSAVLDYSPHVNTSYTIAEINKIVKNWGLCCISEEGSYQSRNTDLRWRCDHNHEYTAKFRNIRLRKRCLLCNQRQIPPSDPPQNTVSLKSTPQSPKLSDAQQKRKIMIQQYIQYHAETPLEGLLRAFTTTPDQLSPILEVLLNEKKVMITPKGNYAECQANSGLITPPVIPLSNQLIASIPIPTPNTDPPKPDPQSPQGPQRKIKIAHATEILAFIANYPQSSSSIISQSLKIPESSVRTSLVTLYRTYQIDRNRPKVNSTFFYSLSPLKSSAFPAETEKNSISPKPLKEPRTQLKKSGDRISSIREMEILAYLQAYPQSGHHLIAKDLSMSNDLTYRYLLGLVRRKKAIRVKDKYSYKYSCSETSEIVTPPPAPLPKVSQIVEPIKDAGISAERIAEMPHIVPKIPLKDTSMANIDTAQIPCLPNKLPIPKSALTLSSLSYILENNRLTELAQFTANPDFVYDHLSLIMQLCGTFQNQACRNLLTFISQQAEWFKPFDLVVVDLNHMINRAKDYNLPLEEVFREIHRAVANLPNHRAMFFASKYYHNYLHQFNDLPGFQWIEEEKTKIKAHTSNIADVDILMNVRMCRLITQYRDRIRTIYLFSGDKDNTELLKLAKEFHIKVVIIVIHSQDLGKELYDYLDQLHELKDLSEINFH